MTLAIFGAGPLPALPPLPKRALPRTPKNGDPGVARGHTDPAQRRADILQTIDMLGPASAVQIAHRAGYDRDEALAVLNDLAKRGDVVHTGVGNASTWGRP